MKQSTLLILSTILLFATSTFAYTSKKVTAEPDDIVGIWQTGEAQGLIQIYKKGNKYYGKLVWLKEPNDANGKPKLDVNNPNPKLRNTPINGLENLRGFTFNGSNVWENGKIYDPQSGKDYSCKMTLTNAKTLEVRGFIGISLIGRTDVWKKQR